MENIIFGIVQFVIIYVTIVLTIPPVMKFLNKLVPQPLNILLFIVYAVIVVVIITTYILPFIMNILT